MDGQLNLALALTETGRYEEAYRYLREGLKLRMQEDPQNDPLNDFQLHFLYLLQRLVPYDTSVPAKQLHATLKSHLKTANDVETRVRSSRPPDS